MLTHVVSMIIVTSVYYHLCKKTLNILFLKKEKRKNLWSDNALHGMHTLAAVAAPVAAPASDAAIAAVHNLFAAFRYLV